MLKNNKIKKESQNGIIFKWGEMKYDDKHGIITPDEIIQAINNKENIAKQQRQATSQRMKEIINIEKQRQLHGRIPMKD